MLKKIFSTILTAVLAAAAILYFLIWFNTRPGVSGLLVWHTDIAMIPLAFKIVLCVILLLAALTVLLLAKDKKAGKVFKKICLVVNILFFVVAAGLTGYLMSRANVNKGSEVEIKNIWYEQNLTSLDRVAVSSDPHWNRDKSNAKNRTQILKTVGNGDYDMFFCLGDISEYGDVAGYYTEPVRDFNEYLKETPLFALMGNHDALIAGGSKVFNKIFYGKEKADQYYCLNYGDTYFIILDLLWGSEELNRKQMSWLESTLKAIPQESKVIVLSHAFMLSSGYVDPDFNKNWFDNPDMIEKLCPVFEKYKVDLVISGHNHLMELLKKDGVTYVVIGAMGGVLDSVDYRSPYSVWVDNKNNGFLDMDLSLDSKISFDFKDQDGKVLYSETIKTN